MKYKVSIGGVVLALALLSSCSIQQMAFNSVSDMMAPSPAQKAKKTTKDDANPMLALTGESDVKLVSEVMPVILKTYELMHFQNPKHRGLALMSGELYIMYANAFVQTPADELSDEFYTQKDAEYVRAKKFYVRGADYVAKSFELAYPGFSKAFTSPAKEADCNAFLEKMTKDDVEGLFWLGSGILGAFSLDPMDPNLNDRLHGAVMLLERAVALDPSYNSGGIWEVLTAFYAAAPEGLGGGLKKAEYAYKQAMTYSEGKNASTYVTYARSFCIPKQDAKAFDAALEKALEINPDDKLETRLMTVLSQNQARLLKARKDEFFLEY